jgi:hypothetical protein
VRGGETEGATAGENDRVNAIDKHARGKQVGLTGARRTTTHIDRRDRTTST